MNLRDEPLLFELGSPGRRGIRIPDGPAAPEGARVIPDELRRDDLPGLPELSELDVLRHYVRASQWNYAAATQFYPLGSCTMKYNPIVNEQTARLPGFADLHPAAPDFAAQGALALMAALEDALAEIVGLDAVSLQPAAGAQGELVGMKMIRAWHRDRGEDRRKVLIPKSAHGTNPASSALCGFEVVPVPAGPDGTIEAKTIANLAGDDVAALMITIPNTLGLFEAEIVEISRILHDKGALVYVDGANMNALMGVAKPGDMGADVIQFNLHKTFSTPHGGGGPGAGPVAVREHLVDYLPTPRIRRLEDGTFSLSSDFPGSIGRVHGHHGNFGMLVRAWTYIRSLGGDGLRRVTEMAILNANYLRRRLADRWQIAFDRPCLHECVFSDASLTPHGIKTLDVAKRLLDYGCYAPTIYFPLVVSGALMIEPTESESKETLDAFVDAMNAIADEAERDPELLKNAPTTSRVSRLDEVRAARHPVFGYDPSPTGG